MSDKPLSPRLPRMLLWPLVCLRYTVAAALILLGTPLVTVAGGVSAIRNLM